MQQQKQQHAYGALVFAGGIACTSPSLAGAAPPLPSNHTEAVRGDEGVREAAKNHGVKIQQFYSETLLPLGDVPGGYVKNCGGNAAGVPGTMSSFQSLLGRINGGNIPLPLDAPKKDDFPEMADEYKDKYLPLSHPCDIEWPRGLSKDEIGPVWNRADADKDSNAIVKGGESLALQQLEKTVTARPDW